MIKFKKSQIFIFVIFLISWFIFGWNTWNADYNTYLKIYNNLNNIVVFKSVEIGFAYFMSFCRFFGFSYNTFLKIYSFIGLFIIYNSTKYFIKNYSMVIILYLIYPFFIDVIQIRNFMSFAIILFGIRFLLNDSLKSKTKYIMTILVASSFHLTSLYYLILLLTSIKSIRNLIYITLSIFLIITVSPKILYYLIQHFYFLEKYKAYFVTETRPFMFFLFFIYFLIFLLIAFICNNILVNSSIQDNERYKKFGIIVLKIDILLFTSLPLIFLNVNFYRLQRNILILNYILFSIIYSKYIFKGSLNIFLIKWTLISIVILSNFMKINLFLDVLRNSFHFIH